MGAAFPPKPVKKTETVSYRIRSDLRQELEEEAKRLGINPNALVSQILTRHVSWGRYVGQLKFIPVSKDFLRLMFESFPRENLEKIARMLGEGAAHEELLFLFQRITPGTILQFIDLWASHFDAYDHQYEAGKHIFTIKHDVNQNFSHFTKEYVSAVLQSTVGTSVQFEAMSPNSVTFIFESAIANWARANGNGNGNGLNRNRSTISKHIAVTR